MNDYSCPTCRGTGGVDRYSIKGAHLGSGWICDQCGGKGRLPDRRGLIRERRKRPQDRRRRIYI